jgi:hypothetical protein
MEDQVPRIKAFGRHKKAACFLGSAQQKSAVAARGEYELVYSITHTSSAMDTFLGTCNVMNIGAGFQKDKVLIMTTQIGADVLRYGLVFPGWYQRVGPHPLITLAALITLKILKTLPTHITLVYHNPNNSNNPNNAYLLIKCIT